MSWLTVVGAKGFVDATDPWYQYTKLLNHDVLVQLITYDANLTTRGINTQVAKSRRARPKLITYDANDSWYQYTSC